jgi:hypothetical protein
MGFELRALHLLGRHSTTESHFQPFFALVTFQVGSHVFRLGPNRTLTLVLMHGSIKLILGTYAMIPGLFDEMESY